MNQLKWYALQVTPSKEGKVSSSLMAKGYQCLLPLSRFRKLKAGAVQEVRSAVFPGYLFCRLDPQQNRSALLFTPDVVGLVGFRRTPAPIEDSEIAAIWRIAESGVPVEPRPYMKPGTQIQLLAGPLSGLRGTVIEHSQSRQLIVSVELLQRSIAVEISPEWAYSQSFQTVERSVAPIMSIREAC